jgi:hypothetical protein
MSKELYYDNSIYYDDEKRCYKCHLCNKYIRKIIYHIGTDHHINMYNLEEEERKEHEKKRKEVNEEIKKMIEEQEKRFIDFRRTIKKI